MPMTYKPMMRGRRVVKARPVYDPVLKNRNRNFAFAVFIAGSESVALLSAYRGMCRIFVGREGNVLYFVVFFSGEVNGAMM